VANFSEEVPRPKHGDIFFFVAQDMLLNHRAKGQLVKKIFREKAISTGLLGYVYR